jgi:hypothetical protein
MVLTLPGAPWQYSRAAAAASNTGTVAYDVPATGRGYLTKVCITYDASAAARVWIWGGTTATAMITWYPTTATSFWCDLGPIGLMASASGGDIGWCASSTGPLGFVLMGYTR